MQIRGVGTTGSGRKLAKFVAGADIVKTEITAHASASKYFVPDIKTILEIGGQDSKIIILRKYDGKNVVVDYAMNSICAAGCGAFLDHQANRLKIPIEEFEKIQTIKSTIDLDLLEQFVSSFKDIK